MPLKYSVFHTTNKTTDKFGICCNQPPPLRSSLNYHLTVILFHFIDTKQQSPIIEINMYFLATVFHIMAAGMLVVMPTNQM